MVAGCDIPPSSAGACSGKCSGGGCSQSASVLVIAACEGRIALFGRSSHSIGLLTQGEHRVAPSLEEFRETLAQLDQSHRFSSVVLVGSTSDLAWVHVALPVGISTQIAAEIEYPLVPAWFREAGDMPTLRQALESLFR